MAARGAPSKRLLGDLPLPPSLIDQLSRAGFRMQHEVMDMRPTDLAKELGVEPARALEIRRVVAGVWEEGKGPVVSHACDEPSEGRSALEILQHQRSQRPIYSLNEALDRMLGGGVPRGALTEFCGAPGMGKTQLAMQLACDVQVPEAFGGVQGQAVYIDTEGSFMVERVVDIVEGLLDHLRLIAQGSGLPKHAESANSLTKEALLSGIYLFRVHDYVEQLSCVKALPEFLRQHSAVRLVLVDSVAFHFRRDFEDMALRSRLLTGMAQDLLDMSERFELAVVLTNQVTTKITSSTSHLVPALGESWAHACTSRVMLHWGDGQRMASLIKSPSQCNDSVPYAITSGGFRGVPRSTAKRKEPSPPQTA